MCNAFWKAMQWSAYSSMHDAESQRQSLVVYRNYGAFHT